MNRKQFGKWLNEKRQEAGLSKRKAARALGYKGLGTIHTVEQGINPLPIEQLHPVCRIYKIVLAEMLSNLASVEPKAFKKYMKLRDDILRDFIQDIVFKREDDH